MPKEFDETRLQAGLFVFRILHPSVSLLHGNSKVMLVARHSQTWTKVNVKVDEGVACLVETLSQIPGLETIESCQGYPKLGVQGQGYVCFCYGNWRKVCSLAFVVLGPELAKAIGGKVAVSVEACDAQEPLGRIEFDSMLVTNVAFVLRRVIASLRKANYNLRRFETPRHPRHNA